MNLGIISMQNEGGHNEFNERRDNQNPYLEEEQTIQKKTYKRTNNDLHNIHIKLMIE